MDKGDTVEVIQGALGSGKSAVGHVQAILHLKAGGVVATNYAWTNDWAWNLAGQSIPVLLGLKDRQKFAECMYCRNIKIGSPETLYQASDYMKEALAGSPIAKKREGKGLMVIDEAHHYFNSRDWSKKVDGEKRNDKYIEFFANARKLGWRVLIITHSIQSIDTQIRAKVEYETFFRNLKKVKAPFLPIPLSPVPLFFTITRYSGLGPGKGSKAGTDLYWLDKLAANLYDTAETFHMDNVVNTIDYQGEFPNIRTGNGNIIERARKAIKTLLYSSEKKKTDIDKEEMKTRIAAREPFPQYFQRG